MTSLKLTVLQLLATIIVSLPGFAAWAQNGSQGIELNAYGGLYDVFGYSQLTIEINRLPSKPGFRSSVGYYLAAKSGRPINGKVIWSDVVVGVPTTINLDLRRFSAAERLGFFLIPDGAEKNAKLQDLSPVTFALDNGKWTASLNDEPLEGEGEPAHFTDPRLNAGGQRQALINIDNDTIGWKENTDVEAPTYETAQMSLNVIGQKGGILTVATPAPAPDVSFQPSEGEALPAETPVARPESREPDASEPAPPPAQMRAAKAAASTASGLFFYDIKDALSLTVDLKAISTKGEFKSSLGYYLTDETGRPYRGRVIWADVTEADSETFTVSRNALGIAEGFGFFIIPNGAFLNPELTDSVAVGVAEYDGEWTIVRNGVSLNGASLPAFLAEPQWNADGVDHVADSDADGNMNWEDEFRGGNRSYDDINIDVLVSVDYGNNDISDDVLIVQPLPVPFEVGVPTETETAEAAPTETAPTETEAIPSETALLTESEDVTAETPEEAAPPAETEPTPAAPTGPPAEPAQEVASEPEPEPFWGRPIVSGFAEAEVAYFPSDPLFDRQSDDHLQQSVAGSIEYVQDAGSRGEVLLELFGRYDQIDSLRSFGDIQRAHVAYLGDLLTLRAGVLNETWGVLELENIVDIVNQRNIAEDFRADAKLGQPGIKLGLPIFGFGQADVYYLPYPRKRPFVGEDGRFQFVLPVDDDDAFYETAADDDRERWAEQWAARAQFFLGDFEAAISHFYGTSRDPVFDFVLDGATPVALSPDYDQINQSGVELRAIALGNIVKAEAFRRTDKDTLAETDSIYGAAAGIEREFVRLFGSDLALTLFGEYYFDNRSRTRDEVAPVSLDNDVFVGGRLAFNDTADTQALLTSTVDIDTQATILALELQRRFGTQLQVTLKGETFIDVADDPGLTAFQEDHRILLRARYYY
ncbi:MAG: hypothetical protein AAF543_00475 [Pseudomonadota bacterium]